MKAKAPEKVYLHLTKGNYRLNGRYYEHKPAKILISDKIIEYTRTDAFIEKAERWLKEIHRVCDITDEHGYRIIELWELEKSFENFMKGE